MPRKLDITIADVNEMFSEAGNAIREIFRDSDHWGIGGLDGTQALARRVGFKATDRVLDVGSGLGGPARYLARQYGCRVVGLDVSLACHQKAVQMTRECGLEQQVEFHHGSALDMPFKAESFDVVWGVDAWAHVTDKERLIRECARVLKQQGIIAFVDMIEVGEMADEEREPFFSIAAIPYLETLEGYGALLEKAGFEILEKEDVSGEYLQYWDRNWGRILERKREIIERFGQQAYDQICERFEVFMASVRTGKIGEGRFIGRKQ